MQHIHSFPPIEDSRASILILGSMPGKESLRAGQYYAYRRNTFWPIMGDLIGALPTLPYESRIKILKSAGMALWDVLASCTRDSSLDADIDETSTSPNDFASFFLAHPHITQVFFNGTVAEKYFRTLVQHSLEPQSLHYQRLPSTSPTNASMPYHQKLNAWEAIIQKGLTRQTGR
jgi:double-stranded uracil-DNA glycosylase